MTERPSPSGRAFRRTALPLLAVAVLVAIVWAVYAARTRTIFDTASEFGRVRVLERGDGLRTLVTGEGRARQSAIHPGRPLHLELAYTRVGMIGLALLPPEGRMLFVGLGGGAMPMYARQIVPEARIDVVEIDPVIVDVARRYFGFTTDDRMTVHTGDGRAFIESAQPGTYDLIVLDAFSDDEVPYALTTREFLRAVRAILTPGGVVVSNLWSRNDAFAAMIATYQDVFEEVHLVRVPRHAQYILVASASGRSLDRERLAGAARELGARRSLGFDLSRLVSEGYESAPRSPAAVLRDTAAARE
ncbi:MAG TPA: fused MFS/spermidine synthase [Longimicrobiales bacterium]